MGLLDFLKITIKDKNKNKGKKAPAGKAAPRSGGSSIEVDSRSYPLAALTAGGFVATRFDGSLIKGQNARITVNVNDAFGKFTFQTTVTVSEVQGEKLIGQWSILDPQLEATIRKYAQLRKQGAAR